MSNEQIAEEMHNITAKFQQQTGIADEAVDRIIEYSFRKMELTKQEPEYILLLLPDELKNYCFRSVVNLVGYENLKEECHHVRDLQTDTVPPTMPECAGTNICI